MRSKLFTSKFKPSDDFKEDARVFSQLSSDQLNVLADWLSRKEDLLKSETNEEIRELSKKADLSGAQVADSLDMSEFLIRQSAELEDSLEDIVADMAEVGLIDTSAVERLLNYLLKLQSIGQRIFEERERKAYELGTMPVLAGEGHAVDLRLSLVDGFDPDEAAIEEYKPALRGLTPIAIVGLVIRDQAGKREQISFQVGFEALEKLIMRLQACQKEMRLLQQIQQQLEVETDERQGSC